MGSDEPPGDRALERVVDRSELVGDAPTVAPTLLGKTLVHGRCAGRIIEVEAYTGDDPASHSRSGPTARNASMFEREGTAYVYLSYGVHHCLNVVTGARGDGQAVLIRALEPLRGVGLMRRRRGPVAERLVSSAVLCGGPGKLCQALAVDLAHDGSDLCSPRSTLRLVDDGIPPPDLPIVGPRVGISRAVERPWRWRMPAQ